MKGSKGECLQFNNGQMINKTKFDTEKNCLLRVKSLKNIGVAPKGVTIYKCKECGFWHLGKPEHAEKYGV